MKFTIEKSKFINSLKAVQNLVSGKGALPILQNVLIEANGKKLKLTTTDLDISISSTCVCEVKEQGRTTLPVKILFNSILKLPEGEVTIEIDVKEKATITAGNVRYRLAGLPEFEFPRLPKDEESFLYVFPRATLQEMFRKTAYAASQDDTRRTLKGVLLSFKDNKLTMVATDGRRLALVESETEVLKSSETDLVLPSKAVSEIQRSLGEGEDVLIKIQKSQVCFDLGDVVIYSKLMEDTYPNYRQVIPNEVKEHISVDRQLLLDALERVSVMTIDESHSIKLIFQANKLTVTSAANDIGDARDEVPIKYAGEMIEIMFNPSYVMDPLKAIDDDEISIELNNGHSPAVIKCAIPFLYVLMPLRIS